MLRIEISNLEMCRDILEQYNSINYYINTNDNITKIICEKLDINISDNYSYISDLLTYLLDTTTIMLDIRQVDLLMVIIENITFDYPNRFGNNKIFRDLMSVGVLPEELKNVRIDYVLNKIKESRGQ